MSTLDASAEAKRIAGLDHQSGKGAEAASATLSADYNNYLAEHGNDTKAAQKWLQDTTAELAKAGVLPDITIGVLSNEKDNLSSDGDKITHHDIVHDNFLLTGSSGSQQSFDSVFTDMLANNTNGITDQVNAALGSNDGTYTTDQFNKFKDTQDKTAQQLDQQNAARQADAGLYGTIPGTNVTVMQYLDSAKGVAPDGVISRDDINAALANPLLPADVKATITAFAQSFNGDKVNVKNIMKQDGVTAPDGSPRADANAYYQAATAGFNKANDDYKASQGLS
jgi:hypothetical protein